MNNAPNIKSLSKFKHNLDEELKWYHENVDELKKELDLKLETSRDLDLKLVDVFENDCLNFTGVGFGTKVDGINSFANIIKTVSKKIIEKNISTNISNNLENSEVFNLTSSTINGICNENKENIFSKLNQEVKIKKSESKKNLKLIALNEKDEDWERNDFPWSDDLDKLNEEIFGNKSFRANQRQIMNAIISQRDVFVMMPTGGGKSLCFQLPGLISSNNPASVTVVIMPLVALITDQMEQLNILGIKCASLNSSQPIEVINKTIKIIKEGSVDSCPNFLFVTPEKLKHSKTLFSLLHELNNESRLLRFAIDEAHCVCQWGFDFRPDYIQLYKLREEFPNVPIIALTATATHNILNDVINQLRMKSPVIFSLSFDRPNIRYQVRPKTGSKQKLMKEICGILKSEKFYRSTSIIYCLSRNECEEVCKELNKEGILSTFYHGSMKDEKRTIAQRKWMNDEKQVMVATIAFGMGINKKDVRLVIHLSMPKSLENYYQESGRAGRDGLESLCILYYTYKDVARLQTLAGVNLERPSKKYYVNKSNHINNNSLEGLLGMIKYCEQQYQCRRIMLLRHFGENFNGRCNVQCDNCIRSEIEAPKTINVKSISQQIFFCVKNHLQNESKSSKNYGFLTIASLSEILKGKKKNTKINQNYLKECFGLLKDDQIWKITNIQRLLHVFIVNQLFIENVVQLRNGATVACLRINNRIERSDIKELNFDCFLDFQLETDFPTPELLKCIIPLDSNNGGCNIPNNPTNTHSKKAGKKRQSYDKYSPLVNKKKTNNRDEYSDDNISQYQNQKLKEFKNQLLFLRRNIANEFGITNVTSIASKEAIDALVENLPLSLEMLGKLPGWGAKSKLEKFGLLFVSKVREFVDSNSVQILMNYQDDRIYSDKNYMCPIDFINPEDLDKELDLIGL